MARLSSEKGIEYLLESIPELKKQLIGKFLIVFAGPKDPVGEEKYIQTINQLAKKYINDIQFLGTLQNEEVGAFYSLIDVLVLPSVNSTETFGMVQVEAMKVGTPVVATDLPGVRVPIQYTSMGVIVKPKSSKELATGITEVLKNKQKYLKNKHLVDEVFSFDKVLNQYEQVLGL